MNKERIYEDELNGGISLKKEYDLVVFCHLRWEFVTQRPQHLISRIGKDRKALFVEEPIGFDETNKGTANVIQPSENITVIQPRIPWENMFEEMTPIVREYMQKLNINKPIVWFYSAAFLPMKDKIESSLVVYDCMDELSAFKGASPDLIEKEKELIRSADVVFTGGKSMYESKSKIGNNVHCFPSSVDRKHFEKALDESTEIPEDISSLNKPIVGYYGVIDERIDLDLLDKISSDVPDVTFLMIGPVVKIDESDLPRNPNIVYPGGKKYEELPNYLKFIDICMMPFAMNESTKFISPTKTLEYMVACKPIISTPIYDVVRDYSDVVKIVENSDEFVAAIQYYLNETNDEKQKRQELQKDIIEKTSWDNTANEMMRLMADALTNKKQ